LPATYEEYVTSRKKRLRRKIRDTRRWLEEPGTARTLATVDTEETALAAQACLVQFHQARWKEKGYPGAFADPRVVKFHENVIRAALSTNTLRMHTLSENGQIIAVSYNFRVASLVQAYLSSFDESWSDARPGVVLRTYVMERAILDGASRFDFLEGTEKYKAAWCTSERENLQLLVFNRTFAGRAAHFKHSADKTTVQLARRFVPEHLREQVVKAIMRKDASGQQSEEPES
jgi:CelD/BcsL family acetyltransferase involved in cellulose biosynthesis